MDGSPSRGETIPIRLFLGGFDLTPTFREVNKKYSTRYYLSLVLIDEGMFHFRIPSARRLSLAPTEILRVDSCRDHIPFHPTLKTPLEITVLQWGNVKYILLTNHTFRQMRDVTSSSQK